MNETIQTIYLISASIGILAMIPQIKKLVIVKQSDGLSLTTWATWGCCQMVSLLYAISVQATAWMYVCMVWIGFYFVMVFLIIKYRKRRGLVETVAYWIKRGREDKREVAFGTDVLSSVFGTEKKL